MAKRMNLPAHAVSLASGSHSASDRLLSQAPLCRPVSLANAQVEVRN